MAQSLERRRRARVLCAVALALAALGGLGAASAGPSPAARPSPFALPHRIVSLNACADEYLIALADRDQVAALTQFATDPSLSFYAAKAKTYPMSRGDAES